MIKQCFLTFFKRFKFFFICFGLILVGFLGAAGIFYGGLVLTLHLQGAELTETFKDIFYQSIKEIKPADVISLKIISRIYKDFIEVAGEDAYNVKIGITLSAIAAVFAVYGSYKGSVAIVNYINKRQLRNKKTKRGFVPFVIKLCIGFAFSFILLVLLNLWTWSFIFVLFFYILIDSFEAVVSIRYIYFSEIKLREFLFSRTFIKVMSLFLIFQYAIIFIASALWFASPFLSLFVMIPVLAYSETNIQYTIINTYKDKINA